MTCSPDPAAGAEPLTHLTQTCPPSSWFLRHTLFPLQWLEVKDPTGSRSWHQRSGVGHCLLSGPRSWHPVRHTCPLSSWHWALEHRWDTEQDYSQRMLQDDLIRQDKLQWSSIGLSQTSVLMDPILHMADLFYTIIYLPSFVLLCSPFPCMFPDGSVELFQYPHHSQSGSPLFYCLQVCFVRSVSLTTSIIICPSCLCASVFLFTSSFF